MLILSQLSHSYPTRQGTVPSLEGISCALPEQAICAIVGPSGGGKSTLLNMLSGSLTNYSGEILLGGRRIDPRTMQIALVPQHYGLLPWKTVRDNLLLPQRLGRRSLPGEELERIIQSLGLDKLLDRYPHELSGGQRQRTALARAFGMKPDLLLLDEPFSALDIVSGEQSRHLFLDLWQRYPTTTLLVTHSPMEASALASRVLVLAGKPGRLIADLEAPSEAELRQYLSTAYDYELD